jgi:hypothetical protein
MRKRFRARGRGRPATALYGGDLSQLEIRLAAQSASKLAEGAPSALSTDLAPITLCHGSLHSGESESACMPTTMDLLIFTFALRMERPKSESIRWRLCEESSIGPILRPPRPGRANRLIAKR